MANEWDVVAERPATADDWTVVSETPTGGGPNVTTLDERQAMRAELKGKLGVLKRQIQEMEKARGAVQMEDYAQIDAAIAGLRREQKALEAQIERTGVGTKWRNIGSTAGSIVGGVGGAIGGGLIGGPKGAVAGGMAGSAVGTGVGSALGTAADIRNAEPITPEEAERHIRNGVVTDVLWDVGGSAFFLVAGKTLKVALEPGLKQRLSALLTREKQSKLRGIAVKAGENAQKAATSPDPYVSREATEDVKNSFARAKAVDELNARMNDASLTPGQVRGEAGPGEYISRSMYSKDYQEQAEVAQRAARSLRDDTIEPTGTPSRPELGEMVLRQAENVERAVKQRTAPVFEAAKRVGVETDVSPIVARIEAALAEDAGSANRLLKPAERNDLQNMLRDLTRKQDDIVEILGPDGKPFQQAAGVRMHVGDLFNFVSGNKSRLRDVSAVEVPSRQYQKILGEVNDLADAQALDAIEGIGGKSLRAALLRAREDYRGMMTGIYDGNIQRVLAKEPEKVGGIIWQDGNVTAVRQFQELVRMGVKEGTLDKDAARELNEQMLRGFLREAVPNIEAAAKFSQTLNANVKRRETFQALLGTEGVQQLDDGMRVLEQAAQMALMKNNELGYGGSGMLANLKVRGLIGLGLGYISPGTAVLFATAEGWAKMMATALTRNDKGLYRNILIVLRASSTDNPKLMAAARPAAVAVAKAVTQLGDADLESQFDMEALNDVLRVGNQEEKQ